MLLAEIRLYSNLHTPTYHAVIGDVVGASNIDRVLGKLGGITLVEMAPVIPPKHIQSDEVHWMPQAWPLPFWAVSSLNPSPISK
jgi:hypothetical protein